MTFVTLTPDATTASTGALTGSSVHAALSDASDSTYVTYDYGEHSKVSFSDLSLPSGAQLVSAQLILRCAKNGTAPGGLYAALVTDTATFSTALGSITWESPQELGSAFQFGGLTDAGLDTASATWTCVSLSQVIVYEASVRVLYLEKPIATVTSPSGTITTNLATVNWGGSFDVHTTSSPAYSDVKVFSAAQYGAGGFNPSTSAAVCSSGVEYGAATSRAFSERLPDGAYRAYVRIAPGNPSSLWSDWDYEAFTVSASLPGEPSVTLTGEDDKGRIRIDVDCRARTDSVQVQRDSGDGFVNVRTADGEGSVAFADGYVTHEGTLYDYEAPNGVTCTYRVRAYDESNATYSDWVEDTVSWSSDDAWLKCVGDPSLNVSLVARSYESFDVPANQGVFRVLGSSTATVVSDVPGPESGQVTFMTSSDEDREALSDLLASGSPILLQVNGHPDRLVSLGDRNSTRLVDKGWIQDHDDTLNWTLVGEDGRVVGVGSWPYPDAVPVKGLALFLPLGASAGLTDRSGNSRNGTAVGGLTAGGVTEGPLALGDEGATDFDGTDDRITTTYSTRRNYALDPRGRTRTTDNWRTDGTFTLPTDDTSWVYTGAARWTVGPVANGNYICGTHYETVPGKSAWPVVAGTRYSSDMRFFNWGNQTLTIEWNWRNSAGASLGSGTTTVAPGFDGHVRLITNALAPANAVVFDWTVKNSSGSSYTGSVLITNMILEAAASIGDYDYFDGEGYMTPTGGWASEGATGWLGVAHKSSSDKGCFANGTSRTFMGWAWRDASADADTILGGSAASVIVRLNASSNDFSFFPNSAAAGSTWTAAWPGNGQWVHWALTFNEATDTANLYINGVFVSAKTNAVQFPAGAANLQIAARATEFFDGKQAWVSVHERALTATEILTAYNAGRGIATLGPYLT